MTNIRCKALRTDLHAAGFKGKVERREGYWVVMTPDRPDFFWGKYLAFDVPPPEDGFLRWCDAYDREFGQGRFKVFTWDDPLRQGVIEPFVEQGFRADSSDVFGASALIKPPRYNRDIEVRPLRTDLDWSDAVEVHVNENWYLKNQDQRSFVENSLRDWRDLCERGLGRRYGAFLSGRVIGDCGYFVVDGTCRFNSVATHPEFRRRGVCSTLVYETGVQSLQTADRMIVVAASESEAGKVYRALGFQVLEKQFSLEWWSN